MAIRFRLICAFAVATWLAVATAFGAEPAERVLRIGMPLVAETFDPARSDNMQANMLMAGIYDTLYVLDPLARPAVIVPVAAAALPEVSSDFREFTIRIRPGIRFTPHAAFGGKARELTAADFAYALRRVLDPKIRSPGLFLFEGKIEGLDALAKRAADAGTAIDYDAPVSGLVAVDRQTLRIRLNKPDPIFPFLLTSTLAAGVAREVVEVEGAAYGQRPVGTGAFVVSAFTPGQRATFLRNPSYRTLHWEDLLAPVSRQTQGTQPLRGKTLPGLDRVEFSSTPESSAELLALRRDQLDLIYLGAPELATRDGKLLPELARDGVHLVRQDQPTALLSFFSMRDPVLGGNSREKIALRRAIQMAIDDKEWIRVFDAGFSTVRQQVVPPGVEGHIPGYVNPNNFDPAAANALLDRFGFRKGADGYRRNPDGSALTVTALTGTSSEARKGAEFSKRMLDRIGIRITFESVTTAERLKRMLHCRFGMASMDWGLDVPDGTNPMSMFYSKSIGSVNMSCYEDAVFDAAFERALVMPPGPERTEQFRTMQARLDAYAPTRPRPISDTLLLKRDRVIGPFGTVNDWLQIVTLSVDTSAQTVRSR
jgi:oligopeptide transport system substrate-binding protein